MLSDLRYRLRALFHRSMAESELEEELQYHLEREAEEYGQRGIPPGEAMRKARLAFGGKDQVREACRDARGTRWLEDVANDARYAVRCLARNRGFTAAALVALALGIGANTAMFSVVYSVLLKPLPYRDPDRLVWIATANKRFGTEMVSVPDFVDWRAANQSFEAMAAFMPVDQTLTGSEDPTEVRTTFCSESIGRLFGVQPILGRDFTREELSPGAASQPVLITDAFFQGHFGGNSSALGQTLVLDGQPHTLIGVLPASFRLALPTPFGPQVETDAIVPYVVNLAAQRRNSPLMKLVATQPTIRLNGQPYSVQVLARLRRGIYLDAARAELQTIQARLPIPSFVIPGEQEMEVVLLRDRILGNTGRALVILLGAVGFVLLIACTNVANLQLSRAAARIRELAMRKALGASRARLIRQMLTESLVLALGGGLAGMAAAALCIRPMVYWSPLMVPHLRDTRVEPAVLAFALGISLLTGVLFGMAPALAGVASDLNDALKLGSASTGLPRRRATSRELLVVTEVALALILLAGAGLMVKSLWRMHASAAALAPDRVLTADLQMRSPRLRAPAQAAEFVSEFLARVESIPGVRAAAVSVAGQSALLRVDGSQMEPFRCNLVPATPHFFAASGVRLLKGRLFAGNDTPETQRVAIVNESLARRLRPAFPKETPVGLEIQVPVSSHILGAPKLATIVGVVSDFRTAKLDAEVEPAMYLSTVQDPMAGHNLLVRASSDPTALIGAIRAQGHAMTEIALLDPQTLAERLDASIAPRRFQMTLLVLFASLAVLLAIIGIYGVVAYMVTQRTREIGIRMALGARQGQVIAMVLARGMRLVGAGVVAGLAAAFALTRLMSSFLYGVKPGDASTFVAISVLLLAVAAVAAWLPARRAATIAITAALRCE